MLIHQILMHSILFTYQWREDLLIYSKGWLYTFLYKHAQLQSLSHIATLTHKYTCLLIPSYTYLFKNLISHPSLINYKTPPIAHLAMIISLMDLKAYTTTQISSTVKIAQTSFSLDAKKGEHSPHGPIPSVLCRSFSTWTDSVLTGFLCFHGKPFKTMSFR